MILLSILNRGTDALITDPTWIFFLVLAIILAAPLLRRLHIPHVVGLILAGVLIGEHGLNLIELDRSFEIFGKVGIYYIMFVAALELDMGSMKSNARNGLIFGLLTFCIPFAMGYFSSVWLLGYGVATSVLMGCVYGSHTLVTYPIVGRYGLGRHRTVVVSVVSTALAMLAALLVLAVVLGGQNAQTGSAFWLLFLAKCTAYFLIIIFALPRLCKWFLRRYEDSVLQYIFSLSIMFLCAALAKLAGIEGVIGAFLGGMVLNRLIPRTSPLMNRIEFMGNALFIPYFLIGVGMTVDVGVLFHDAKSLWLAVLMVVVATSSKWLASVVMKFVMRESWSNCTLMFGLTNAQAAGTLAVVTVATSDKVSLMDPTVINGTVIMILATCVVSSFATNYGARRLALQVTAPEENHGALHGRCLVAYSQTDNVAMMTQMAILIRNPNIPDGLMGLTVAYDRANDDGADRYERGKRLLEQAQSVAVAVDVPMVTLNRISPNIASGILYTMREYDCGELIVCLNDRKTGMPKSSLGTIIDTVLEGIRREVMALRCIVPPGTLKRIVVVVPEKAEYEVGFFKWLEHVCRIAEQLNCRMEFRAHSDTLVHIRRYLGQKHPTLLIECVEMGRWGQLLTLSSTVGADDMLVVVTSRPGFVSYQGKHDSLPLQIHRYFSHTSVMLLFPDQWGDPEDAVSVFEPNGQAITGRPHWLRKLF